MLRVRRDKGMKDLPRSLANWPAFENARHRGSHVIFVQFQVDLVRIREVAMPGTLQHGGRLIRPERSILRLRPMSDAKSEDEPVAIGSFYPRAFDSVPLVVEP